MNWWKSVRADWARWRRLSGLQRQVVRRACLGLLLTAIGLRLLGLRRWQETLRRWPWSPPLAANDCHDLARLVRAAARRLHGEHSCLPQALVLWWLLRGGGFAADLRIGVRKRAGQLEAHAWVEQQGKALDDRDDVPTGFTPFAGDIVPSGSHAA
jgi:hypothetical protein